MPAASGWDRVDIPSSHGRNASTALPAAPQPIPEPEPEPPIPDNGPEQVEQFLDHQIALSVANLEDQLESVQREATEVLGVCGSTAAFTNEVRDGLRSARASMAEQRAAMDKILACVSGVSLRTFSVICICRVV